METPVQQSGSESGDAVLLMLRSQEERISELERSAHKSALKKVTESASASALFLGLVLTFASLYDTFVAKPETDRISRISQFNQAVNAAAKLRQDITQAQMQQSDPQLQLAISSAATPQVLNNIATAKAMLRGLDNSDVGIPQLTVLISEAFFTGDVDSAKSFVERAVGKTDVTPYLRAEAKRYEGRYRFATGNATLGRASYEEALKAIGGGPGTAMQRAFILGDLVVFEFTLGDCATASTDLKEFTALLATPQVTPQVRSQLGTTLNAQLVQLQGQHCPMPANLGALSAN